jgi:hypothetical protein
MIDQYKDTRTGQHLNVIWRDAVITYAAKVARYGFTFGASITTLGVVVMLWPLADRAETIRALIIIACGGGLFAGMFGGLAVIVKDAQFPYLRNYEVARSLPVGAAVTELKPWSLHRVQGNTTLYGKQKMETANWLALAQAIIVSGETTISQRKLAEWGVITSKESSEGKQIKADLLTLGYAIPAGNDTLRVTPLLAEYLAGRFPALAPLPSGYNGVSNGVTTRHHHQTPPNGGQ